MCHLRVRRHKDYAYGLPQIFVSAITETVMLHREESEASSSLSTSSNDETSGETLLTKSMHISCFHDTQPVTCMCAEVHAFSDMQFLAGSDPSREEGD